MLGIDLKKGFLTNLWPWLPKNNKKLTKSSNKKKWFPNTSKINEIEQQ